MSDIRILWDTGMFRGDWRMNGGALEVGHDLETAVLVSLFTWRTVDPAFALPPGSQDPQGWWADAFSGDPIGSRLWQLFRAKKTNETLRRAESYARESLQWLIDDGVAASVEVTAEWHPFNRLALGVVITAPAQGEIFRFSWVWNTLTDPPKPVAERRVFVLGEGDYLVGEGGIVVGG